MPDLAITTIEVCLKALDELPHDEALAALDYVKRRLLIKERHRQQQAQQQKAPPEPIEKREPLDDWGPPPLLPVEPRH
jgi:hypothetical protein